MLVNVPKIRSVINLILNPFRDYRREFFFMVLFGFLSGIAGGLGISAIIPLFALLTPASLGSAPDFVTRSIEGIFHLLHVPLNIPLLLLFIIVLFLLKAVVTFSARSYNELVSANYERKIRTVLFRKTLHTEWPSLIEYKMGHLERVLLYDIQQNAELLSSVSTVILTLTSLFMYGIIAINISTTLTIATGIFGLVLFFVLKPILYRTRKFAETIGKTYKLAGHQISQSMLGIKIIKSNVIEDKIVQEGVKYFNDLRRAILQTALYNYAVGTAYEPISFVFIAGLFLFSYRTISFNVAAFAAAVYLIQKIFSYIQALQGQVQTINELLPYMKTVADYEQKADATQEKESGTKPFQFSRSLEFRNVSFAYTDDKNVLAGISFSIQKGMSVGIIGPSGGGKTTTADLLLRFLTPDAGAIYLDDRNIQDIALRDWRHRIGYVPQEVFLLNDTIENNIKFYNDSMTHDEVIAAAQMANIYDTIRELPNGFQTDVGERGLKLSGGQRQRIALARTLARKPEILILDEATSALDNESEALIQDAITSLKDQNITIIVIAHRINTIMRTERVFVLDEGKIVESGTPEALVSQSDSYLHKIYNL